MSGKSYKDAPVPLMTALDHFWNTLAEGQQPSGHHWRTINDGVINAQWLTRKGCYRFTVDLVPVDVPEEPSA